MKFIISCLAFLLLTISSSNAGKSKDLKKVDKMYDGFLKFGETLNAVKKAITHADNEIDLATKRLTSGRGNLTRRAEKIRELSTQKGLVKD